jgi:transcriptional regulator with XRE-family HTH domain
MPHYTTDDDAFLSKITFDFVAQLEHRLETSGVNQAELAQKLNVSESAVSQVLNCSRANLNLKTMMRYARALGMKVAIVAYDDSDPQNDYGPVGSEIFRQSWERMDRPRDLFSLKATTLTLKQCHYPITSWCWPINSTLQASSIRTYFTSAKLPQMPEHFQTLSNKATERYARI